MAKITREKCYTIQEVEENLRSGIGYLLYDDDGEILFAKTNEEDPLDNSERWCFYDSNEKTTLHAKSLKEFLDQFHNPYRLYYFKTFGEVINFYNEWQK